MGYNPAFRGKVSDGSSRQTQTGYLNGTLITMPIASPVSVNSAGNMVLLDVTSETSVQGLIGLTSIACPSAATGLVCNAGRLEGITLGGFSVGDAIYAGQTPGALTNVKPDLAVSGWVGGMFVVFFGVYVINQFDPGLHDIQLMPTVVGQL